MASTNTLNMVVAESKATISHRASKHSVPTDLSGQPIPRSKRWVYSTSSVTNGKFASRVLSAILIAAFVYFNSSSTGRKAYEYLDHKYGDYNMNLWGIFVITSLFFWAWAAVFAIPDLTGWPQWLFKYKTQPFIRVDGHAIPANRGHLVTKPDFRASAPLHVEHCFQSVKACPSKCITFMPSNGCNDIFRHFLRRSRVLLRPPVVPFETSIPYFPQTTSRIHGTCWTGLDLLYNDGAFIR
jgi:hypothetical protein